MKNLNVKLAFADFETDPFKRDKTNPDPKTNPDGNRLNLKPFCVGVMHEDGTYWDYWGDDAAHAFIEYTKTIAEPTIFYFHNGGRFDFYFVQQYVESQVVPCMIKGSLVAGKCGIHQLRDSMAIFATSLRSAVGKLDFDYEKMERENREENKAEILRYLRDDCDKLKTLMMQFFDEMGPKKLPKIDPDDIFREIRYTASSYAFKALCAEPTSIGKFIDSPSRRARLPDAEKARINRKLKKRDIWHRPHYYGGRVQMFEQGAIKIDPNKRLKKYDVNSMYPAAMANYEHPISANCAVYSEGDRACRLDKNGWAYGHPGSVYFIVFEGETLGILNTYIEGKNSLAYRSGVFKMVCHEFRAGLELGYVKVKRVIRLFVWNQNDQATFAPFVEKYYAKRNAKKAEYGRVKAKIDLITNLARFKGYTVAVHDHLGNRRHVLDESRMKASGEKWAEISLNLLAKFESEAAIIKASEETVKLVLNGAYGKTAFDCSKYPAQVWLNSEMETGFEIPKWVDFSKTIDVLDEDNEVVAAILKGDESTLRDTYNGVHIAASITSAARATLMRAIHSAKRPLYADTDSLLCEELGPETEIHKSKLGAWKEEKNNITEAYLAGPKLYALKSVKYDRAWNETITVYEVRAKGLRDVTFDELKACASDPELTIKNYTSVPTLRFNGKNPKKFGDREWHAILKAVPAGNIDDYRARGLLPEAIEFDDSITELHGGMEDK